MYNQSTDPQVVYSLTELANAYIELLDKKTADDISITELCKKAGIGRATFYRNAESKEDLIDFLTDRYSARFTEKGYWNLMYSDDALRELLSYWKNHALFLSTLKKRGMFNLFSTRYIHYCRTHYANNIADNLSIADSSGKARLFLYMFLIGGIVTVLEQWTSEGFETPIDTICTAVNSLKWQ